jgi:transcription antitermination factor NusB
MYSGGKMGKRRQSRELAVQFLYQIDIIGQNDWKDILKKFWDNNDADNEIKEFSNRIVESVINNKVNIDKMIESYATNWDLSRIAAVDRNVLRSAISELLYMRDIPPIVAINEAVDIAKKYGTPESGKFVNGILDKIRIEADKKKDE